MTKKDHPALDKKKVRECLVELSNSMLRIEAERDFQKEAIVRCSEESGLDKKLLRKLADTYHKGNLAEQQQNLENLETFWDSIVENKSVTEDQNTL
jgi:hypothetical protein